MVKVTNVFVSVFSSRGDESLEYLLRGILQQTYEGALEIKLLTSQSAFTAELINRLPKGIAKTNYSLELVVISSFRDYESCAIQLFQASNADLFIPCLPNSYWINQYKVQHHVTSMLAGYQVSWHPVVMRDHRVSSARSWCVLYAPNNYSPAFSKSFFTQNPALPPPRPVVLSLDHLLGKQVEMLRLPMVQVNEGGWLKKAIYWLNTFRRTHKVE
jgi:hypothetical protein